MANKIDSNITGLSYAEEEELGVLPATPTWHKLEPNSYNDFGGQLTTIARNPINPSRQRKKGVVTDLDASGGFNTDLTQTNLLDLMQGFFFADARKKAEELVSEVLAADDSYAIADTTRFFAGTLLLASGFTNPENNGLHTVDVVTANTKVSVENGAVDELSPPSDAKVQIVGFQFGAGHVDIDSTGLPSLDIVSGLVAASLALTVTDAANLDGETVTIAGVTYTFQSALSAGPTVANEILIGADEGEAIDNLAAAVNGAAGEGTLYSVGTAQPTTVTAVSDGNGVLTVTAIAPGASGNSIAVAETLTDGAWTAGGTNLAGGTGVNFVEMGLIDGEWVWIGGDGAGQKFTTAANNGFARIAVDGVEYDRLTFDKTDGTMVTEAAGALTISLFFGDIIRNEPASADIVRRSYQLERQLGEDDDGVMSEYLVGAVANTFALNVGTGTKITCDLGFIATNNEQRDGSTGIKSGNRPELVDADAFNTSSDFSRIKLSLVDPADSSVTPLFAFLTELTLNINNNASPNKAVSVLGAFDVTAGTFEVGGSMTAYFASIDAVQAVRDNSDVTLDFSVVKANSGLLFDVPLLALGDGRLTIEQDQPVRLPLTVAAGQSAHGYTLLMNVFPYLPDLAE